MKDAILNTYAFNLMYAKRLVDDVPEDLMAAQPTVDGHIIPNHAAWVIGHLATTSAGFACDLLGIDSIKREGWGDILGGGSKPEPDASRYPDKATLIEALEEAHNHLAAAFAKAADERLAEPCPVERMRPMFPTIGDMITFVLTSHETTHLGQLSAWRRALGLPSAFG